jgi:hypothetical protein
MARFGRVSKNHLWGKAFSAHCVRDHLLQFFSASVELAGRFPSGIKWPDHAMIDGSLRKALRSLFQFRQDRIQWDAAEIPECVLELAN